MNDMSFHCRAIISLDLSSFNTINVKSMEYMFMACFSLKSINFSSFNTTNVTNMSGMFNGCKSLEFLDLSTFETPHLTSLDLMFMECSSLKYIDLSLFNTAKVHINPLITQMINLHPNLAGIGLDFDNIFGGCFSLERIKCNDELILGYFEKNKKIN